MNLQNSLWLVRRDRMPAHPGRSRQRCAGLTAVDAEAGLTPASRSVGRKPVVAGRTRLAAKWPLGIGDKVKNIVECQKFCRPELLPMPIGSLF